MDLPIDVEITVYSKPNCTQCTATYHALDKRDLPYRVVNVSENPAGLALIKEMGYSSVPVVVTPKDHWAGFRPDKISGIPEPRRTDEGGYIGGSYHSAEEYAAQIAPDEYAAPPEHAFDDLPNEGGDDAAWQRLLKEAKSAVTLMRAAGIGMNESGLREAISGLDPEWNAPKRDMAKVTP